MKRILIVDDASFIRMMIKDALKSDFEVVGEAKSVPEAVALYAAQRPDAVTMDIALEGDETGIDALAKIRALDAQAVVVMVSSLGEEEYIKRSIDLGAAEFIVKPFSKETVRDTLKSALGM